MLQWANDEMLSRVWSWRNWRRWVALMTGVFEVGFEEDEGSPEDEEVTAAEEEEDNELAEVEVAVGIATGVTVMVDEAWGATGCTGGIGGENGMVDDGATVDTTIPRS